MQSINTAIKRKCNNNKHNNKHNQTKCNNNKHNQTKCNNNKHKSIKKTATTKNTTINNKTDVKIIMSKDRAYFEPPAQVSL